MIKEIDNVLIIKFKAIFEEFFLKRDKIKEVILQEGVRIFFKEGSKYVFHDLNWNIEEDDLKAFQISIIKEQVEGLDDTERMNKIFLDIENKLNNKGGSYNYNYNYNGQPFRINWSLGKSSMGKEISFMRIRKIPRIIPSPKDLLIPEALREEVRNYKRGGIIIVSAPPGSGKSTTIASVINELIHEETLNIITLEDPIEYIYSPEAHISSVEQRERGLNFDTYRSGIEGCMRQDPDIVVVQEMTTPEIIEDVMLLASKGVMVITTLHTADTTEIFESILTEYPVEKRKAVLLKLKDNFRLFVSQRLLNKRNTKKQIAVFEVLRNNPDVKGYLAEDNIRNIHQIMNKNPHISFARDIANKIESDEISIEEGLKMCPETRLRELKEIIGV